jgi:hypothetical protein
MIKLEGFKVLQSKKGNGFKQGWIVNYLQYEQTEGPVAIIMILNQQ